MARMKRILDSVHGYISVPEYYMDNIVDSPCFQRLRRIEQTSCRALFPSARHDRFIHSLGVFHLGTLISDHLWKLCMGDGEGESVFMDKNEAAKIIITYRLACLLHDVGHTPFSHTFEDYFINDENDLVGTLTTLCAEDKSFYEDFEATYLDDENQLDYKAHEVISAIMAIEYYHEYITSSENNTWDGVVCGGDIALLARMIVGCKYRGQKEHCLENIFIELIHGDVIDSDGLDYVCRDVWASGYSTSAVDVSRLINAIMIHREGDRYFLCYDARAINEIKSLLQVKNFQQNFVFSHHLVRIEQELLKQSMKSAAIYQLELKQGNGTSVADFRESALKQLCNIKMYKEGCVFPKVNFRVHFPMDDDFIIMMKMVEDDVYVKQWLTRKYKYCPIWKTKSALLADLPEEIWPEVDQFFWLFQKPCKDFLIGSLGIDESDFIFLSVQPKDKMNKLNTLNLYTNDKMIPYPSIYGEYRGQNKNEYSLIYVLLPHEDESQNKKYIQRVKESLIKECLRQYSTK